MHHFSHVICKLWSSRSACKSAHSDLRATMSSNKSMEFIVYQNELADLELQSPNMIYYLVYDANKLSELWLWNVMRKNNCINLPGMSLPLSDWLVIQRRKLGETLRDCVLGLDSLEKVTRDMVSSSCIVEWSRNWFLVTHLVYTMSWNISQSL